MKIRLSLLVAILLLVTHTALPEIEKVGRVCGRVAPVPVRFSNHAEGGPGLGEQSEFSH
jgi:hypothetical protein